MHTHVHQQQRGPDPRHLNNLKPAAFDIVLVEERLSVLKGRDHNCARGRYLEQPRKYARIQTFDAARLIYPLHRGQDTVTRCIRSVRVDHLLAQLDLLVRLHHVKWCREKGGNLFELYTDKHSKRFKIILFSQLKQSQLPVNKK